MKSWREPGRDEVNKVKMCESVFGFILSALLTDRPPAAPDSCRGQKSPAAEHAVCAGYFYLLVRLREMPPTFPALLLGELQQSFSFSNKSCDSFHTRACTHVCTVSHFLLDLCVFSFFFFFRQLEKSKSILGK